MEVPDRILILQVKKCLELIRLVRLKFAQNRYIYWMFFYIYQELKLFEDMLLIILRNEMAVLSLTGKMLFYVLELPKVLGKKSISVSAKNFYFVKSIWLLETLGKRLKRNKWSVLTETSRNSGFFLVKKSFFKFVSWKSYLFCPFSFQRCYEMSNQSKCSSWC